ncbi:MAG: EF2563 family selenium-dependent molybdenum hydroxylase system protein [Clostridium sp.]|nr:EF2563 family selenium-dependent molybdenum hydroxylase system protein [Clostridium sp.]
MKKQLNIQSSLRLTGGKKAFGPGAASLLEGVARLGSLRKSAADMEMSYSKAWAIIKNCEEELGVSLLDKKIGGKGGGGAALTREAENLLKRYREFEREAKSELDALGGQYFPEYIKSSETRPWILVRGAGDLATGVILRLYCSGFKVAALECRNPSAIRRRAAFCEAVWTGETQVEGVSCRKADTLEQAEEIWSSGKIPLLIDETASSVQKFQPAALIDMILAKRNLGTDRSMAPITIGAGPGFTAGEDVDAVIETMRGHFLGRVIWEGQAIPDTGVPGEIQGFGAERVIHAPAAGRLFFVKDEKGNQIDIGASVKKGQTIAMIEETPVKASLDGVLRGLIREGFSVKKGLKIADIDPRPDQAEFCGTVSDKARAVAGGVLEALLGLAWNRRIRLL